MWSKKEFTHAVYHKNVVIVKNPSVKKNIVSALMQVSLVLMPVNALNAIIGNL